MGRPPKFDRDTAVEAAMNEIWKHGMEACSTKGLAEHLGISRSSFYNAFGSPEGLFREALSRYFSQTPDCLLAELGPDSRVLPVITQLLREVCRSRAADPDARGCMAVNCVAELVGVDDQLGPLLEDIIHHSLDRFEALLQRATANGELAADADPREKALALQTLLIGINLLSKVVRSEAELWAAAKQTLEGLGLYRK